MRYFELDANVKSVLQYSTCKDDRNYDLSIVIPTYKRMDLLKETIKSILMQQKPKHIAYEVVIVSNDQNYKYEELIELCSNIDVRIYINEQNVGMCGNMNRCALLSAGKYVCYLQDDDLLLTDYLLTIERLMDSGKMNGADCIIPNRYYYYDLTNKDSIFGLKSARKELIKEIINRVLRIGCRSPLLKKVTKNECYRTFYNGFAGGPTCGMLFERNSLVCSEGFNPNFPYAFDFVFFVDFSEKHNVLLFDKELSVYRMTNSASNNPKVQLDFYRSELNLIDIMKESNLYNPAILKRFAFDSKSPEAQKLIRNKYGEAASCGRMQYLVFRIVRYVRLARSGLYRRRTIKELPKGLV